MDNFGTGEEIMKAIIHNEARIYFLMSQLIIRECATYLEIEQKAGRMAADEALSDCFIILRRQVKSGKVLIQGESGKLKAGKNQDIFREYLFGLYRLVIDTGQLNPSAGKAREFEERLIGGQGLQKLSEYKDLVRHTLYSCGCTNPDDQEEIFNESLLTLWKKLCNGETGIYFMDESGSIEHCRIFNRKFYQQSKVSTYLSGIARNIFMNRTRNAEYTASRNFIHSTENAGEDESDTDDSENIVLLMFLYYRIFIEPRKLRSVISLLQYDCCLEDKEVQELIGIQNTRIHSCRLRAHFYEWHSKCINNIPEFLDKSNTYFRQRESRRNWMNFKIRMIDSFGKKMVKVVDLSNFREEFYSPEELNVYAGAFRLLYYLISTGKSSALTGLPDEAFLRNTMQVYKQRLFAIPAYQSVLLLLFYGTEEPVETICQILKHLETELKSVEIQQDSIPQLADQLEIFNTSSLSQFSRELYQSNRQFYEILNTEINSKQASYHETLQDTL